jgi:hypothetical protein
VIGADDPLDGRGGRRYRRLLTKALAGHDPHRRRTGTQRGAGGLNKLGVKRSPWPGQAREEIYAPDATSRSASKSDPALQLRRWCATKHTASRLPSHRRRRSKRTSTAAR